MHDNLRHHICADMSQSVTDAGTQWDEIALDDVASLFPNEGGERVVMVVDKIMTNGGMK